MKANNYIVNNEEQILFALRDLYEAYGYSQYKMVKFEEYDFYAKNKDFLVSDNIITFNDTNGKLMALKPDVTLSIIKNTKDCPDERRKVYYNENVYRVSKSSHSFKEIMQAGIECIGDIDSYIIAEILSLAASSLKLISNDSILSISNLDILSYTIDLYTDNTAIKENLIGYVGEKNINAIEKECEDNNLSKEAAKTICSIAKLHGKPSAVFDELKKIIPECNIISEFENVVNAVYPTLQDMLEIDFSYAGDIKYYNGIAFKGFVNGIPESVLSGGQYDGLMKKMGRKSAAIGFAVYLGTLERLGEPKAKFDVDTVILYDSNADISSLGSAVKKIADTGVSVMALKSVPQKLKYKKLMKLNGKEAELIETNA